MQKHDHENQGKKNEAIFFFFFFFFSKNKIKDVKVNTVRGLWASHRRVTDRNLLGRAIWTAVPPGRPGPPPVFEFSFLTTPLFWQMKIPRVVPQIVAWSRVTLAQDTLLTRFRLPLLEQPSPFEVRNGRHRPAIGLLRRPASLGDPKQTGRCLQPNKIQFVPTDWSTLRSKFAPWEMQSTIVTSAPRSAGRRLPHAVYSEPSAGEDMTEYMHEQGNPRAAIMHSDIKNIDTLSGSRFLRRPAARRVYVLDGSPVQKRLGHSRMWAGGNSSNATLGLPCAYLKPR